MKFVKNNFKLIIGFIVGVILAGGIVYAAAISANQVDYSTSKNSEVKNVEQALNDLYNNKNNNSKVEVYNDLFNNNKFQLNGTQIKKDSNNDYYFDFDGVDDYIQVATIPATANFIDGFTIEFKAKWDAFNHWSRILDFGNGPSSDNIVIANYQTTNNITFLDGNHSTDYTYKTSAIPTDEIVIFKFVYSKNNDNTYNIEFFKDNNSIYSSTTSYVIKKIERTKNYLGKSNWSSDTYFKGRIYSLKIDQADGTNIIDVDINRVYK